jgi:hypothetical protein
MTYKRCFAWVLLGLAALDVAFAAGFHLATTRRKPLPCYPVPSSGPIFAGR